VAHFLIRAIEGDPIVLYGDGMQVRDILFIEDLVDAFLLAQRHMDRHAGTAFNIGGGAANTTSLLELLDLIEELHGERPDVAFQEWRTGDQRYYVSDTRRFQAATGWRPRVGVEAGVARLYEWLLETRRPARATAEIARRAAASTMAPATPAAGRDGFGSEEVA
jgi:CDP-paratose 2-epimerase